MFVVVVVYLFVFRLVDERCVVKHLEEIATCPPDKFSGNSCLHLVCLFVCLFVYSSICLFVCLFVCLFIHSFVYLFFYLFVFLFVVYLFV